MKLKSILAACAIAALPYAALAQQTNPPANNSETTETKIVTVTGHVKSYDAGHTITITNDKGEQATYTLNESSEVPKDLAVGKTVTIRTETMSGSPVVKTVTITTTTTTKKKSY
jgi:hypothetical protein